MSESVVLDYEINAPIANVWHALTDSASLARWMMFKTNTFRPEIGHQFQFSGVEGYDSTIECTVTELDEPHKLSYTWQTTGQSDQPHATIVTWLLESIGPSATRLHLEQTGFRPEARQEIGGATYGWQHMLAELDSLLTA